MNNIESTDMFLTHSVELDSRLE